MRFENKKGFTIIELLVVIVILAILATIVIVVMNGVQARARDSKRAQDITTIKKALFLYQADHGGLPTTTSYGGAGLGGWNSSLMGASWLPFLNPTYLKSIPTDSTNTGSGDPNQPPNGYFYYYYCYGSPTLQVRLGYRSEITGQLVDQWINVESCT